jgi:hypothetical protein
LHRRKQSSGKTSDPKPDPKVRQLPISVEFQAQMQELEHQQKIMSILPLNPSLNIVRGVTWSGKKVVTSEGGLAPGADLVFSGLDQPKKPVQRA